LKAWRCQLFVEFGRTANWAIGQRRVAHFLQNILGMAAGVAFVGVNGHVRAFEGDARKPSIIGLAWPFKA
jgi:hypothetical protein